MKSLTKTIIFILFFAFIIIGNTMFSQIIPKKYSCFKASSSIQIDGNVYDEAWTNIPWSDFFKDIEDDINPEPYLQTRMKMLWDNEYLYIAAELEEPHIWGYLNNQDDIVYRDNDFEVFIDPTSDGLNYFEIEVNALGTILDLFMNKPYNKGGHPDLAWDADGLLKKIKVYGSVNDTLETDLKWTVELAIPWSSYTSRVPEIKRPDNGDTWRINFSRVQWETEYNDGKYKKKTRDDSGKPLPENNWVWSPQGKINMHIPEKWGYITFINEEPSISECMWTLDGFPKFWVWMGANSKMTDYKWEALFRKLDDTGIKGFLFGGDTSQLKRVIPIADQYNIHTHSWFWTMNRGDANPEWLSVNQLGKSLAEKEAYVGYYKFMCPALPEVRQFIIDKMNVLSTVEGLKGIHMDYIRYVDVILPVGLQPKYGLVQDHIMPEFDYGYHPYMRSLFKQKTGIDPLSLEDPGNNRQWIDFRLSELNKTIDSLKTHVRKKSLNITAAVFPTPDMSADMVRQDWRNWSLDCYFPMVYHNFYNEPVEWIGEVMKENRKEVGTGAKLFCGLYLPALQDDQSLSKAIKSALNNGSDGVSLFSIGGINDNTIDQIKEFTLCNIK